MISLISIRRFTVAMTLMSLPAQAGEIVLTQDDLLQIVPDVWTTRPLEFPEPETPLPILGEEISGDGVRLLRLLSGKGTINGFDNVVYDNRDRDHSDLKQQLFPSLTHLEYEKALVDAGLDFGLAGRILLPAVVFGNSSMAMTEGAAPRSLPRLAMTNAAWRTVTSVLYENNHLYVYPEHRDYDAQDRFPVNWPYMIISEGSSRSDLPFLNAIALTLASFPRDTFEELREKRLVAPTVQMLLRRNLKTVESREDYLSGLAHPTAFYGKDIRPGLMIAQAADLRPEDIPPLVRLRVTEEDFSESAGLAGLDEHLLDTHGAIGRLWRSFAWERELLVTTEDTKAPNDKPLTFEWRLLRGDPERVSIEPQGADGRTARIRVAWHDPWTESVSRRKKTVERQMSRVDIGVFVNNGVLDSAPAMISIDFPEHQVRRYSTGDDGETRLESIDYDAAGRDAYVDPLLYWSAPWKDTARYDESGALSGWERRSSKDTDKEFVPNDGGAETPGYEIDYENARMPVLRRIGE